MLEKNLSGKKCVEWRKTCAVVIGEDVSVETYIEFKSLFLQLLYVITCHGNSKLSKTSAAKK